MARQGSLKPCSAGHLVGRLTGELVAIAISRELSDGEIYT
jgi:hypothetical protein